MKWREHQSLSQSRKSTQDVNSANQALLFLPDRSGDKENKLQEVNWTAEM